MPFVDYILSHVYTNVKRKVITFYHLCTQIIYDIIEKKRGVYNMEEKQAKDGYRIAVRVDRELRDRFNEICRKENLMGARVLRSFVENFVKEHEEKLLQK